MLYVQTMVCADTSRLVQRFFLKRCTSGTYQIVRFLRHTIVCTYSIYKEAPEDGPLRSEACRADTYASINNQCCNIVYLVGMYIYWIRFYILMFCFKLSFLPTTLSLKNSLLIVIYLSMKCSVTYIMGCLSLLEDILRELVR